MFNPEALEALIVHLDAEYASLVALDRCLDDEACALRRLDAEALSRIALEKAAALDLHSHVSRERRARLNAVGFGEIDNLSALIAALGAALGASEGAVASRPILERQRLLTPLVRGLQAKARMNEAYARSGHERVTSTLNHLSRRRGGPLAMYRPDGRLRLPGVTASVNGRG